MIGAIAGDIIGAPYEWRPMKRTNFPLFRRSSRFTDDTVLTVAVADCLLYGGDYVRAFHDYYHRYPRAGFGGHFRRWARRRDGRPYNSWGNGSAMRVSPVGFAFDTLAETLEEARRSAEDSHNHPEGIKGAQATAAAIWLARHEADKDEIRAYVEREFGYNLERTVAEIRPHYHFDVSCQGSVPEAIIAFLESTDYETAVRNAVSLGGDADTLARIAGGIAEAYYGVPEEIRGEALARLDDEMRRVVFDFSDRYGL